MPTVLADAVSVFSWMTTVVNPMPYAVHSLSVESAHEEATHVVVEVPLNHTNSWSRPIKPRPSSDVVTTQMLAARWQVREVMSVVLNPSSIKTGPEPAA